MSRREKEKGSLIKPGKRGNAQSAVSSVLHSINE